MPNRPRPLVAVTRPLDDATMRRMAELFDVECLSDGDLRPATLADAMRRVDVIVPTIIDPIDAAMLEAAGPRLKLIASYSAGVDHVDLAAARARNVIVTNTPGVLTEDTADMAMALIIGVTRRLVDGSRMLRDGRWGGWAPGAMLGHRLAGKTLGIVGMGRIGQAIARRAAAFGLRIAYHNRRRLRDAVELAIGARFSPDLQTLLGQADIVSINCPLTPQTRGLFDAAAFAAMRPDAYLVNVARGEIVEEDALIAALTKGTLGGAGLDVYAHEPAVDPRLLACPNVLLLPHMGSATWEGRAETGVRVVANIRAWSDGHRPPDQVLDGWL